MNLYYGLTNYHLLCGIVHKLFFLPNEDAIFVASEGRLEDRIEPIKISGVFQIYIILMEQLILFIMMILATMKILL